MGDRKGTNNRDSELDDLDMIVHENFSSFINKIRSKLRREGFKPDDIKIIRTRLKKYRTHLDCLNMADIARHRLNNRRNTNQNYDFYTQNSHKRKCTQQLRVPWNENLMNRIERRISLLEETDA